MIFVYGYCNGNGLQSAREYSHNANFFRKLRESGNPALAKNIRPQEVDVEDEETLINFVIKIPGTSTRRVAQILWPPRSPDLN